MSLSACPNCSSLSGYLDMPFVRRPDLVLGRKTRKVFFIACCAFSAKLFGGPWDSYADVEDAWDGYRSAAARQYSAAGFPRLAQALEALDERERFLLAKRVGPAAESAKAKGEGRKEKAREEEQVAADSSSGTSAIRHLPSHFPKRVSQAERRAPAAATEIYNAHPSQPQPNTQTTQIALC